MGLACMLQNDNIVSITIIGNLTIAFHTYKMQTCEKYMFNDWNRN